MIIEGYFLLIPSKNKSCGNSLYRNDPKISPRQVWENSADPDQTDPLIRLSDCS